LTEPAAGSDAGGIQARAVRHGDIYKLSGTKSWVSTGGDAGVLIAFAKTDPAAGSRGITAFLLERNFPGFRVSRYEDKMGLRSSHTAEIVLDECEVPVANRLGEEGLPLGGEIGHREGPTERDLGELRELMVAMGNVNIVMRPFNKDYFAVLALKPDGNLGRGRYELRKAELVLAKEFAV